MFDLATKYKKATVGSVLANKVVATLFYTLCHAQMKLDLEQMTIPVLSILSKRGMYVRMALLDYLLR